MIKIQRNSKKRFLQQYDYYPAIQREPKGLRTPRRDREIITAMRYNFDIKNSLFDYQKKILLVRKITSQLFTAATQLLNDFTRQTIKKISSEINRAIHFLLQIILMLSLSLIFSFRGSGCARNYWRKTTHISCDVTLKHDVDKDISPS